MSYRLDQVCLASLDSVLRISYIATKDVCLSAREAEGELATTDIYLRMILKSLKDLQGASKILMELQRFLREP